MSRISEAFLSAVPVQEHLYYNIHFSIDAGYVWDRGMSQAAADQFYNGMKETFSAAGWTVEYPRSNGGCPTFHKGGNALYCHPMELSGPCEPGLIDEVEALIKSSRVCHHRFTKVYDQIYDITNEQYQAALDSAKDHIEADLMAAFSTKRRNLYHHGSWPQLFEVAKRYCIPTLDRHLGISSDDIFVKHVQTVFDELVSAGKIIHKDDPTKGKLYRSATGPELLEKARKQAVSLSGRIQNAQQRATDQNGPGRKAPREKGPSNERG